LLKQAIYDDVLSWVGSGGGGGGGSYPDVSALQSQLNALSTRVDALTARVVVLEEAIANGNGVNLTRAQVDELIQEAAESTTIRMTVKQPLLQADIMNADGTVKQNDFTVNANVAMEDDGTDLNNTTTFIQ
jgi:hypothetical protein